MSDQFPPNSGTPAGEEPVDPWATPEPGSIPPGAPMPPVPPQNMPPGPAQPPGYPQPPVYGQQPPGPPQPPVYGQQPPGPPQPPAYGQATGYGQQQPPGYPQPAAYGQSPFPAPATTSNKSTLILILGISSLVLLFLCGLGIIPAIAALALAGGAKREIAQSGGRLGGKGQITAGVVCSIITLVLLALGIVFITIGVITGGNNIDYNSY